MAGVLENLIGHAVSRPAHSQRRRSRTLVAATGAVISTAASPLVAAVHTTYYWAPGSPSAVSTGGSGTWDTSTANWNASPTGANSNTRFPSASNSDATFDGTGDFTLTLGTTPLTTGQVAINGSGSYSIISGSGSSVLDIYGTDPGSSSTPNLAIGIAAAQTLSIGSNVTVNLGDPASGKESLVYINGTGTMNIGGVGDSGTVVQGPSGGSGSVYIDTGTTVNVGDGGTLSSLAGSLVLGGTLNVSGTGAVNTPSSSSFGMSLGLAANGAAVSATFDVSGGLTTLGASGTGLNLVKAASSSGTTNMVNLTGGTLRLPKIITTSGSTGAGIFNFDGGTLQVSASNGGGTFWAAASNITANVQAGGAIIDVTGTNGDTIAQNLIHDPTLGATPDGGLTKTDTGTLKLTGDNTYTGGTIVSGGTLIVANTTAGQSATGAGDVTLTGASILTSAAAGTSAIAGSLTVGGSSTVNAGGAGAFGTLSVGGLSLEDAAAIDFDLTTLNNDSPASNDLITDSGSLAATGITNIVVPTTLDPGQTFSLITFTTDPGVTVDDFEINGGTAPAGYSLALTDSSLVLNTTAVPEPVSALLGFGSFALIRRRRQPVR